MTLIFECSNPFQRKRWVFQSGVMLRFGWAWFAFAYSRFRYDELVQFQWTPLEKDSR